MTRKNFLFRLEFENSNSAGAKLRSKFPLNDPELGMKASSTDQVDNLFTLQTQET